ncbi:Peroxisomal membrane protein 11A [Ancistrocladus abbreviatus]
MEGEVSDLSSPPDTNTSRSKLPVPPPRQQPPPTPPPTKKERDFLSHLEVYLAKRDGVDKLLKISRYATKILLSSSVLPENLPLSSRLKSFESSVGLSRKAFRLGKFVQDINALRTTTNALSASSDRRHVLLSILAYGGEGLYYFVEQFIWLANAGLIDPKHASNLQKVSVWAEFVGYIGSISLKIDDLKRLNKDKACLGTTIEVAKTRDSKCYEEVERERALTQKIVMKKLSIVQDFADVLMALADVQNGKGRLFAPIVVSSAGLLSALISTHKNWVSC